MPVFAVTYRYSDDAEARAAIRPDHRRFLGGLADEGVLLVSGPYAEAEAPGALLLFRAESKDELQALIAGDPFRTAGVLAEATVTEWNPVSGPLAERF